MVNSKQQWHQEKCPIVKKNKKADYNLHNRKLIGQMNEKLIEKINSKVRKGDTLYILGDVFFGNFDVAKKVFSKIKCGRKILVRGNHDKKAKVMLDLGFSDVIENEYVWLADSTGKKQKKVLMSHFPYMPPLLHRIKSWVLVKLGVWKPFDRRYLFKRIQDRGDWLLCGHLHSRKLLIGKRQIHVGVDALGGVPISEVELLEIING